MTEPIALDAAGFASERAREVPGTAWLARLLRAGAVASGALFLSSVALDANARPAEADLARKLAASALLATPVARLVVAGAFLGAKGERRYAACAVAVVGLLALALALGLREG